MNGMNGKVALITGASSGIGWATSEALASRGASVVLAARRQEELTALAQKIQASGGRASYVRADVSVSADVENMIAHTLTTFGRLDYAVNNAAYEGTVASIAETSEAEWDRVMDTNLRGVFLCLKHEARAMLAGARGGVIVNVGSINSFLGVAGFPAYVASKHALIGLTSSVSAELGPKGIRVNLVCPGIIDTPMHHRGRALFGDTVYDSILSERVHLRRAGRPEEIAKTIVFFCSDEASYITGTTLTPDGGLTLTL